MEPADITILGRDLRILQAWTNPASPPCSAIQYWPAVGVLGATDGLRAILYHPRHENAPIADLHKAHQISMLGKMRPHAATEIRATAEGLWHGDSLIGAPAAAGAPIARVWPTGLPQPMERLALDPALFAPLPKIQCWYLTFFGPHDPVGLAAPNWSALVMPCRM